MKPRLRALAVLVALSFALGMAGNSYVLAQVEATGTLKFLDAEPLTLNVATGATSITATVAVSNGSDQAVENVRFFAVTQDASNNSSAEPVTADSNRILPLSTRSFHITIPIRDSTQVRRGFLLVLGARSAERAERPLQLRPQPAPYQDPQLIVLAALGAAILLVALRAVFMRDISGLRWNSRMGRADWDFSKSWASTLTVLSAVFTSIAGAVVLPSVLRFLPKEGYGALSLLFSILVVVAGVVYNSLRTRQTVISTATGSPVVQYQGYVIVFLVSTVLTLWAVLGQLVTIFFLLAEILAGNLLYGWLGSLLQIIVFFAIPPLLLYAWKGIHWTVEEQIDKETQRNKVRMQLRASGLTDDVPLEEPELPKWSLL